MFFISNRTSEDIVINGVTFPTGWNCFTDHPAVKFPNGITCFAEYEKQIFDYLKSEFKRENVVRSEGSEKFHQSEHLYVFVLSKAYENVRRTEDWIESSLNPHPGAITLS